jgi:hypothetical protein
LARAIFDSDTPVQPKSANKKEVTSVGDVGGLGWISEPDGLQKLSDMRFRTSAMGGSGYVMFSRRGSSSEMALNE